MKHIQFRLASLIILTLQMVFIKSAKSNDVVKIPLTYVFDRDFKTKIPVSIAFNHSSIFSTNPT